MASSQHSKTWLITGASQGLGLRIALSALKAGHKVIACARNPEKAASEHPDVEAAGGKWLRLDVTSLETQQIVAQAVKEAGGLDVIVNNAGFAMAGTIEDLRYVCRLRDLRYS
jgi:NAD(P)-dependent dehydrogenase (short-subunit alcohol dehydrogenase family)